MSFQRTLVFRAAKKFYQLYGKTKPEIKLSFQYFTEHPIAPLNAKRTDLILDHARAIPQANEKILLDFACGGGIIAACLAKEGFTVYGLDPDKSEIALAKQFASFVNAPVKYIVGDSFASWEKQITTSVGKKPEVFVFGYALHHFENIEEFLKRLSQYLPPGSFLIVNEENPNSPLFRLKHRVRTWIQNDTQTEHQRTLSEWTKMLEKNSFTCIAATPADFLPAQWLGTKYAWSYVATFQKI